MTALAITPNWKNKTARFKGAVAAGEHVRVTIANDENAVTSTENLRLRVVGFDGRTLAQFPMPPSPDDDELSVESESGDVVLPLDAAPDTWDDDLTPLSCELNLNTVQMLEAVPRGASVPLTVVLEDFSAKTLYFKELCEFMSWPRKSGEEEPAPVNLDNYADRMADFDERLSAAEGDISSAVANANDAANRVTQALTEEGHFKDSAAASAAAAQNEKEAALSAKNAAVDAKNAASAAQTQAQLHAASAATAASNAAASAAAAAVALPLDSTLEDVGKAADAGAVGAAITAERTRAGAAEAALAADVQAEAQERVILSATVQANANAVAALESGKADKSDTYTKTEVDTKIAEIHTFSKLVVTALPEAEAADDKTIYLVPRTGSETPDLCDEYVVVGEAGSRRWEKIGGVTIDLTNYYTKAETDAALAGKASKSDLALHPTLFDIGGGVWVFASDGEGFVVAGGEEVTTLDAGKTSFAAEEYYNTNLTFAYAPNVTTVGDYAFSFCTSLATVLLPAATTVGANAFSYCTSLTTLDLSSFTVAQVEEDASAWGIDPPSGHTVTITCSDGTYTITGD